MSQGVLDLIQAIDSGDSVAIESAFNAEMSARVSERLEDMRIDVAQNMFATEESDLQEEVQELSEEEIMDEMINEVLSKNQPAGDWIKDFVKSDDPKFAGKSEAKRKEMALAAYYAKQKNEEIDVNELVDYLSENEEVLAELSKKTLGSYVRKASIDTVDAVHGERDAENDEDHEAQEYHARRVQNRMSGLERVGKKLAK